MKQTIENILFQVENNSEGLTITKGDRYCSSLRCALEECQELKDKLKEYEEVHKEMNNGPNIKKW